MSIYLSYSGVNTYLDCSEKWWWGKEGWIEKETPEALGMGAALHSAVAGYFNGLNADEIYEAEVRKIFKGVPGTDLISLGKYMLGKLMYDPLFKTLKPIAVEQSLKKDIGGGVTLVGIMDFFCEIDGVKTIIDWKTASAPYDVEYYKAMSEQLVAYKIQTDGTRFESQRFGYCVIGKKEFGAKIGDPQWFWLEDISPKKIQDYKSKLVMVAGRMARGEHFKQPDERKCVPKGKWQPGCQFYELCLGKQPTKVVKNDF